MGFSAQAKQDAIESTIVVSATTRRRTVAAAALGSTVEYFDFTCYTFLLVYFAPLFFPSDNPTTSALSSLAALGVAYIVRPVASIFWGWLGDRKGRRIVLTSTVVLMGASSFAMGLLPTYASIGVAAAVLLVILRALQGISASGENMSASSYVIESAPPSKRALFGAVVPVFSIGGYALGAVAAALISTLLTPEQVAAFGWRIPFLLCFPLALVVLFMRRRLEDSTEFRAIEASQKIARTPARRMFRYHWRSLLRVVVLTVALVAPNFLVTVFAVGFLTRDRAIAPSSVLWIVAIGLFAAALASLPAGLLADRFGRRPVLIATCVALIFLAVPMLAIVISSTSFWLIGIAIAVLLVLYAFLNCVSYTVFAEWFPTDVRLSGSLIGFNVGTAIAGGITPLLTLQLVVWTGVELAPAFWVVGTSLLALAVVLMTRETGGKPLTRT